MGAMAGIGGTTRERATIAVAVVAGAAMVAGGWVLGGRRTVPSLPSDAVAPSATPTPSPPPPPPPPPWTTPQLRDLVAAAARADGEGLRSADYHLADLRVDAESGRTGAAVDRAADAAALALAHDYGSGRLRNPKRFNWWIDHPAPGADETAKLILDARRQGRLRDWLAGLLPGSADYAALRDALAATPADEGERRDRIKANMERWRWLPRGFGAGDQLYVNLPTYRLEVREDGRTLATYRAVIGATDMKTPALSAPVRAVIANPDWIVPRSIVLRSHIRPGGRYIFSTRPDGRVQVRQKPGPGNALGRLKIVFPNPLAIYFHDTPSKSLFGADVRAFSHGCVRVQNIEALAASLVASPDRLSTALAGGKTHGFTPARPWRATIVYLTMAADADGGLKDLGDPYKMDEPIAAALEGRSPRAYAPHLVAAPDEPEGAATPPADAAPVAPQAPMTPDPDDAVVNAADAPANTF